MNTSPADPLPTFVLVGVEKAATTWLWEQVRQHPDVYLPPWRSELNFFDLNYERGLAYYRSFFADYNGERVIGDFTPTCMHQPETAGRIRRLLPGAKILLSLREPVERSYSDYLHITRNTDLTVSFETLMERPDFVAKSLYARNLEPWLELFGRERLHFIIYEQIRRDPSAILADLFRFLDIDDGFHPAGGSTRANPYVEPRHPGFYRLLMKTLTRLRRINHPVVDRSIEAVRRTRLKSLLARESSKPELPVEVRRRYQHLFSEDIRILSTLTGIDFTAWWLPDTSGHRPPGTESSPQ